ncbi:MAG: GIY-YIG nuclease family protein [Gammaproteobacteria bacterium]
MQLPPRTSAAAASGLPAVAGVYLLVMHLPDSHDISVGRLGLHCFRQGWYLYAGSAKGPGGIRSRCARHLRLDKRKRWHSDYLTRIAQVRQVWFTEQMSEMRVVGEPLRFPMPNQPVAGFGASDSRAHSHLFYRPVCPDVSRLTRRMSLYVPG